MRAPDASEGGLPAKENRPTAESLATKLDSKGTSLVPVSTPRQAEHARQVRGLFVVVVETPAGNYRRRAFLTLASAERAVRRAQDAGHEATAVLARLEPVAVVA